MVLTQYKSINWIEYIALFDQILHDNSPSGVYENEEYLNYVKLNKSRMERWMKSIEIPQTTVDKFNLITSPQRWILLTEPWCGDAAHNTPVLYKLSQLNPLITFEIVLRDENLEFMDGYLTNGARAIPKLIVRDSQNSDLFTWGARPKSAQSLVLGLKDAQEPMEKIKIELQKWYNTNRGQDVIQEITDLI